MEAEEKVVNHIAKAFLAILYDAKSKGLTLDELIKAMEKDLDKGVRQKMTCPSYKMQIDEDEVVEFCFKQFDDDKYKPGYCYCGGDEMRCPIDQSKE